MSKIKDYSHLKGKDKSYINSVFGFCYNYYHDHKWTFEIERSFYYIKELHIYFDENNTVDQIRILNKYKLLL